VLGFWRLGFARRLSLFTPLLASLLASLVTSAGASLVAGCSGGGGGSCPSVADSCPDAAPPTFSGGVAALIQTHCGSCHSPGGQEAILPLTSYTDVVNVNAARPIAPQIGTCRMPPPPDTLGDQERQAILQWLACGALDN
jgi:hypothetical protein